MIAELAPDEVFVFGSNQAGNHAGGAARQAHQQFGAVMGVAEGITGQTYAFPTLTANFQKVTRAQLETARDRLYATANRMPAHRFLLTKVGCGIAGFDEADIRQLFTETPTNIIKPEDWT